VLAESLGGGPFHTLRDSIVQVYHIPEPMVISKTIHLLNKKSLERMVSPIEKNEFEVTD
jgi:predicted Fe-Mo cluster-binding NifX family protein